jgi:hypothetical protein
MTPQKKERRGSPLHCKLNMMHMPLCKKWYKMHVCKFPIPVVPHKAVAEVSKIGNL